MMSDTLASPIPNGPVARWLLAILCAALLPACASLPPAAPDSTEASVAATPLENARRAYRAQDYTRAIELLQPLADRGDPQAQYALGYMYHYGQGVPRDDRVAIRWIGRSASQGNVKALDALQRFATRYPEAAERAAQQGRATSQPADPDGR